MNMVLKVFLSMSFSGALLILALVCGERFLKHKISRQWQYYIWLIVILRLLLPFGPETNLMGKTYQAVDEAITQNTSLSEAQEPVNAPGNVLPPAVGSEPDNENTNSPVEELVTAHPLKDITSLLINHIWLIWLMVALGMLIRKVTIYQGFIRYINAGLSPVSDMGILDRLSVVAERVGIKKPIELCVNPLISSPLLIGFFHPCIVLPSVDISEKDFQYIVLHELTHYKRRDMFYKWLVQVTVCLHWFNPFVHLMSREITKACEFSCDEAVLTKMGYGNAQEYGNTLLDAMAAVGRYKENLGAVTLSENKQLLKERLGAIMKFKEQSRTVKMLTFALTLCVLLGAAFVGVFPVAAATDRTTRKPQVAVDKTPTQGNTSTSSKDYATQAERYYEADSLPLFEITFPRLDENTQKKWLEKFYADEDFAFFSVAVCWIDTNSALFTDFAEKAYDDEEMAFFSILIDCMDEAELELWLDRALEDGNWAFQSMLFDKLNRSEEFDELEEKQKKEWAEAQTAEYRAVGVTMDGKDYYYQGQLVNIFLDIRPNKSVYTLNMNPKGTVNIKIVRDAENKITGVSYMTEAEVTELLEDMSDPDDK
ncbi:M56 family metallopeptidase [Acutalibacter muris]|jgi:beta-lactamase regulating signal transducer with metallopeptidase domain|uniref:M56 family metallopeptidase n=1 Tax=Acutalibacter muris TaxID=1796620 RepID=A0A1Z2XN41_9FIRM|nr:M56 family metallopeptidase [Acutalibacter muris]ANU53486.1 hypothetical protein A4V00_05210 [Hungateiclostridiaceae bacterium KB18]ASB39837.1 hypothetical protein ADH66_03760 [Acutalibacter muris]QQR29127.1 M56 family metallopeptidase [Acutalibacter muris]